LNDIGGRPNGSDAAVLWLACVVILCTGYYLAFVRLAAAIDAQHEQTARVSDAIRADAEIATQGPELEREQRAVDEQVGEFDPRADRAAIVARLVQTAARIAGEQGVSLDQVDARGTPAVPAAAAAAPQTGSGFAFEAIPLELTLSGSYSALLAAIRELARAPLPMQIQIAAIERSVPQPAGTGVAGPLSARLDLTLQHLTDDAATGWASHHLAEDLPNHARFQ
jgi:hypothetical protein